MNKKQVSEWASRILWLLGTLFILMASICFVIFACKIGFTQTARFDTNTWNEVAQVYGNREFMLGSLVNGASKNLLISSTIDFLIGVVCSLIAKVLHWFSTKGE